MVLSLYTDDESHRRRMYCTAFSSFISTTALVRTKSSSRLTSASSDGEDPSVRHCRRANGRGRRDRSSTRRLTRTGTAPG